MIKFSDETIHGARKIWRASNYHQHGADDITEDWRAAAAVFEAAANGQVQEPNTRMGVDGQRFVVPATPEPFQAGKRYRTRGAGVALFIERNHLPGDGKMQVRYADGPVLWLSSSGQLFTHAKSDYDLLPGAIDDEPAKGAPTDLDNHALGKQLIATYCGHGGNVDRVYSAVGRRARELLTDAPVVAGLDAMVLELRAERDGWKNRAERAEAAIERVRRECEDEMRGLPADQTYGGGVRQGLLMAAHAAGFAVHPPRELTVTWEGAK